MLSLHRTVFSTLLPFIAACSVASATPSKSADPALSRAKTTLALNGVAAEGKDCRDLALSGDPIAITHIDNANLQQTIAQAQLTLFGATASDVGHSYEGTVVATIVGKEPTGELRGNHHIVTAAGTIRTERDLITLTPTKDKCIVNAKAKVFYKDGTGAFAGYSGTGLAEGALNFCGAPGHAVVYGRLCKAN